MPYYYLLFMPYYEYYLLHNSLTYKFIDRKFLKIKCADIRKLFMSYVHYISNTIKGTFLTILD
jgi:hypothetical protein